MKAEEIYISRIDPEVGTVYADGGFDFDRGLLSDAKDALHGYICPHGVFCAGIAQRECCCMLCREPNPV